MSVPAHLPRLQEVAELNPPLDAVLADDDVVSFLPMSAVDAESVDVVDAETRRFKEVSKGYTPFMVDDVLVAKITPCFENGKIALAKPRRGIGFGSTEFHVIRAQRSKLDPRYLVHFLRQERIRKEGEHRMTGSAGQRRVPEHFLANLPIRLPPLPEQRRIAEILDKADALRAKRRAALKKLDELTQSIFLDMFGDPATNPKGWQFTRLDELCEVRSSKRVFVEELVDHGIPFFRGTEIGQLGEGLVVKPSLFITIEHYERLKAQSGVPRIGDLLLPSICADGRIHIVTDENPFYFKDGRVLWIKVNRSRINSVFLCHYLKHLFRSGYSKLASGTTFAELKIVVLSGLQIPVLPLVMQQRFATEIESIERQRTHYKKQQESLDQLFTGLQHDAFRGNL